METVLRWHRKDSVRRFLAIAAGIALTVAAVRGVAFKQNDFSVHLGWGNHFWTGDLHVVGADRYLLGRIMFDGFLSSLNSYVARALVFVVAVGALWRSVVVWRDLAREAWSMPQPTGQLAVTASLFLLGPYLLRDFDDCGLQILLLFLLTAAVHQLRCGNHLYSGLWFGIAVTYKTVPVICLLFLLWKRQWRPVAWAGALILVLNLLLPAIFIGWRPAVDANLRNLAFAAEIASPTHSAEAIEDAEKPQNQSLIAALSRYLQTFPPEHLSYLSHPWFKQFGNLTPIEAAITWKIVLVVLACVLAWRWWPSWPRAGPPVQYAVEWAVVLLCTALLSPVCWLHHFVLMFPGVLLLTMSLLREVEQGRWRWALFGTMAVIVLLLYREVMGKMLQIVLLSYKLHTLAALIAVFLLVTLPMARRREKSEHAVIFS